MYGLPGIEQPPPHSTQHFILKHKLPMEIISRYTQQDAINDGVLREVLKHRWPELTHGKPILATSRIFDTFSLAAIMEIWNDYVANKANTADREPFVTKMDSQKVWVMDDSQAYTIMFPSDY